VSSRYYYFNTAYFPLFNTLYRPRRLYEPKKTVRETFNVLIFNAALSRFSNRLVVYWLCFNARNKRNEIVLNHNEHDIYYIMKTSPGVFFFLR